MKSRSAPRIFKHIIQQGFVVAFVPLFTVVLMAGSGHDDNGMQGRRDMAVDKDGGGGTFKHNMTMDGVKAEFQIIDLENMNMKDANGATHHVMVKFFNAYTSEQIKNGSGMIKVMAPSKETSVASFRDYRGIYAANFKFIKLLVMQRSMRRTPCIIFGIIIMSNLTRYSMYNPKEILAPFKINESKSLDR